MFKWVARRPILKIQTYLKYGIVLVEHDAYSCPRCGNVLNAGPCYQPQYCSHCGQHVTFAGVEWREDREKYEQIKNRVV